jgi:hypothetical protein
MKQFTVKTQAAFYATIPAGVETNVVVDEKGVMYVPVFSLPNDLILKGGATPPTASAPAPATSSSPAKGKKTTSVPAPEPEPEPEVEDESGLTIGSRVWAKYPDDGAEYEATIIEVFPETEEVEVEWTDGGERSTIPISDITSSTEEEAQEEEAEDEAEAEEDNSTVTADEYADRLEKGMRVNVEWNDGEEGTEPEWYMGTVTKVTPKGIIYVTYDADAQEVALDASQHPQVVIVTEE